MELKHIACREGRLSSFLKEELKMSTGLINRLKWDQRILVNDIPQHTDFSVKSGDRIVVLLDEPQPQYPAEEGALSVIYEDEHLLAVDKPAGMLIHPSRSCFSGTLANFVLGYYQKTGQNSAFHPITRLDRDTFGVVLLAKNSHIHALLQETALQKTYYARVFGEPEGDSGSIDAPIARRPLPSLLRYVSPEGKACLTRYRVLQRQENSTKLALEPVTGRTHQLRVHCAHMGWPILGDPQYGSVESQTFSAKLGLQYQQLCAKRLEFVHPITGENLVLESNMDV